jgi:hypothetical protein
MCKFEQKHGFVLVDFFSYLEFICRLLNKAFMFCQYRKYN